MGAPNQKNGGGNHQEDEQKQRGVFDPSGERAPCSRGRWCHDQCTHDLTLENLREYQDAETGREHHHQYSHP